MVQIDVSKISSKGQVVIPARLRGRYKEGENIIFIDDGKNLILKKETEIDKSLREDIEFAKRTEQGWKDIEEGRSTNVEFEEFIKEIKKW
ncbi:AbrB/MazE/SpoVT family DNA-binding domain-containing protein [Candidatus Pacearchaeota archaeon]|nr:AbrB/MazE/SpoVT family DNA-binding domain-containing protein [Candidatus Pacearchaeota archaeon]